MVHLNANDSPQSYDIKEGKRIAFPKGVFLKKAAILYTCGFNKLANKRSEEKTQSTVACY